MTSYSNDASTEYYKNQTLPLFYLHSVKEKQGRVYVDIKITRTFEQLNLFFTLNRDSVNPLIDTSLRNLPNIPFESINELYYHL